MNTPFSAYLFIIVLLNNYAPSYGAADNRKLYATAAIAGVVSVAVNTVQNWRKSRTSPFVNVGQCIVNNNSGKQQKLDDIILNLQSNHTTLSNQVATLSNHLCGNKLVLPLPTPEASGILERIKNHEKRIETLEARMEQTVAKGTLADVTNAQDYTNEFIEALTAYMKTQKTAEATAFNAAIDGIPQKLAARYAKRDAAKQNA